MSPSTKLLFSTKESVTTSSSIDENATQGSSEDPAPTSGIDAGDVLQLAVSPKRKPTETYLALSEQPSKELPATEAPKKLLILDLNGTLVSRTRFRTRHNGMYVRPYQDEFLDYVFDNFCVMVWSSAQPHSVNSMCALFEQYRKQLTLTWDRTTFGLSKSAYHEKSLTIKDLEKVWAAFDGQPYDATNTILLDDSPKKAVLQPYNSIHLREFNHKSSSFQQYGECELLHVMRYLEQLRLQSNVCNYMRQHPYKSPDPQQTVSENSFISYHYAFHSGARRCAYDFKERKYITSEESPEAKEPAAVSI